MIPAEQLPTERTHLPIIVVGPTLGFVRHGDVTRDSPSLPASVVAFPGERRRPMSEPGRTAEEAAADAALERALVQRLVDGDDSALSELYDRLSRPLFSLALHILHDRSEAEDVLHDAFLAMREKARTYEPSRGSVAGWAITLTRNRAIDRLRLRRRRGDLLAQANPEDLGYVEVETSSADDYRWGDLGATVRTALDRLPPDQRAALQLAYFHGLSQSEIAARLAVPLGTVKARMRRALLRLRDLLQPSL